MSGVNTPSTATLSPTPLSPQLKAKPDPASIFQNPLFSASDIVEYLASRPQHSSALYVFDLAEQAGFGILAGQWAAAGEDCAPVIQNQTRAGAGLGLVGRLSSGSSHDGGAHLTAFTTPHGLSTMAPALAYLPAASPASRLVIQVPNVAAVGDSFSLAPSTAALTTVVPLLPENVVLLLSATPQETVDFTALSYALKQSHVVHLFDQYSLAREIGSRVTPPNENQPASDLAALDAIKAAGHNFFEYTGDVEPHSVFVLVNGPLALVAQAIARRTPGLGVVTVKVLRPWDETALQAVVPRSAKNVHVIDEVPNTASHGILYSDVFGTLVEAGYTATVQAVRLTSTQVLQYVSNAEAFAALLGKSLPTFKAPSLLAPASKKVLLLAEPKSIVSSVPGLIHSTFSSSGSIQSRLLVAHDAFSKAGGVSISRLLLASSNAESDYIPLPTAIPVTANANESADFLAVLDHNLLKTHAILNYVTRGGPVLVVAPWTADELAANLSQDAINLVVSRGLRVYVLNAKDAAAALESTSPLSANVLHNTLVHLAFIRLYLGTKATEELVFKVSKDLFQNSINSAVLEKINAKAWASLELVESYPPPPPDQLESAPLKNIDYNAIAVDTASGETVVNGARLGSWHDAAKHLIFPAAYAPDIVEDTEEPYPPNPSLRPEVPDRTFLVTCTVNRRLTPREYDRNVFHLEFDTQGTGLKYEIGEALGVHGWNDEEEIHEFCHWYGIDPRRLVTIPVPGSEGEEGKLHTRTIFQALQQQIDIFGRPPKSFYTDLAPFASNSVDRHALLFIGSAEGSATFKKLSEKDTLTFVDVLRLYPSAHPPIEVLCSLVGDIKPRHYSIASAQSVVGDRVDLLVVTVDWVTPSGSPRYGQCTRYLADLKIGQQVTVSIKPSVMKLPPDNLQPLILAGLGTGAAPFRAFLQHRAALASQGTPIGPIYYYFGSRHQSQEYLYGEEIEAFILDGVITRAGLAFSRDGPSKVYIQHKMKEDAEILVKYLQEQNGVFYLCGPTWPVPDVYEALVGALVDHHGLDRETAGEYLEGLKEEERYVLEVY